jgi:hypothetical protein
MSFQTIDHQTWKSKLIQELKTKTWEGIQWSIAGNIVLEPLYDAENVEDLGYLKDFHEKVISRKRTKPTLIGFADGLNDTELEIAEGYGLHKWFASDSRYLKKSGIPSGFRGKQTEGNSKSQFSEYDPFFDLIHSGTSAKESAKTVNGKSDSFHIHASDIHQAGGNPVQEIAGGLIAAAFYSDFYPTDFWNSPKTIHLAAGPGFLVELCKIRAMRLLWLNLCSIHCQSTENLKIQVQTSTVTWSKTDCDTNLLRHTLGAMAAILGGADELLIFPHRFNPTNQLEACRLALDIGHLALEESHLQDYDDPAAGSFLADTITHNLAKEAWATFTKWTQIGWNQLLENQIIQNEVKESAKLLRSQFESGKLSMVGVNIFPSEFSRKSDSFPALIEQEQSAMPFLFLDA